MSRLRRIKREAEKRGYIFLQSPLPRAVKNPTAKTIERLSSITPTKLRSKGYKTSPETGELVRQTPRRQEAEHHEQEIERQRERNRIAIERYEERRKQHLEERAKEAEKEKKREREELEIAVENAQTTDQILQIFDVTDPDELQHWAYEEYLKLYNAEQRRLRESVPIEPSLPPNEPQPTPIDWVDWEEPPTDYPRGKDEDEPVSFESQILNNVIIEMNSRKNIETFNFLLDSLQRQIELLDFQYGEGQGEIIMANRFKDVDGNWQNKLEQIDSSDAGEVRDGSFGLLGIIMNGNPSSGQQENLESIIYDQFKWQAINKRKSAYFRR